MTYESKPFSSYLIFNKFNTSFHSGFLSLERKKNTYFGNRNSLRNSHIISIPKAVYSNELISIHVLTLILSGKLGADFPK